MSMLSSITGVRASRYDGWLQWSPSIGVDRTAIVCKLIILVRVGVRKVRSTHCRS